VVILVLSAITTMPVASAPPPPRGSCDTGWSQMAASPGWAAPTGSTYDAPTTATPLVTGESERALPPLLLLRQLLHVLGSTYDAPTTATPLVTGESERALPPLLLLRQLLHVLGSTYDAPTTATPLVTGESERALPPLLSSYWTP